MTNSDITQAYSEGFTKGLIAGLGPVIVVVLILLFLWIKYPNNVKLVCSQIWFILSSLFGVFAERRYVVNHIEGKVGKGIDNIIKKVDGLEAEQIKITLVKNAVREVFIKDKILLMRIQKKDNHGENLANIAHLYSEHLYSKIQPSLNKIQQEGIKLYTAKSILKVGGNEGLTYLDEKYYRPLIAKHSNLQSLLDQLENIDGKGLFYSVFIQEMVFLGEKTMFKKNIRGVHEEVTLFTKFLVDFANRPKGDTSVPMDFRSNNIKVSFILVALPEKRECKDTRSYIICVQKLPKDTESFYFMGWGENIRFVEQVTSEATQVVNYLQQKKKREYERLFENGRIVDAICILARNNKIADLI
jgi:hypothetical protein